MSTEKSWAKLGEIDPYFAVYADDRFKAGKLSDAARSEFFRSGEEHVAHVLATIRKIAPSFSPARALDFGCGVGRITLPLTRAAKAVLAVDLSDAMLAEAKRNAPAAAFEKAPSGTFDLIHSTHVMQHNGKREGEALLSGLIASLNPGGVAVIQLPYHRDVSMLRRIAAAFRERFPGGYIVANVLQGRPWNYPLMLMTCYSLNDLSRMFRAHGVRTAFSEYEDIRTFRTVTLYIFK